jgi:glycosyltransferase involved in cell wall biosynthesis
MREVRVLHVTTSLEAGGMENGICNLANQLVRDGVTTHVACLERAGIFASRLPDPASVTVLGKSRGFSASAVWQLWRTIGRSRPHVVHTHNLGPLIYAAFATLGGRLKPILHGEHSLLAAWEKTPKRLRQRRRFYRACRSVHTVSVAQRKELLELGLQHPPIVAIPNGVDTARFHVRDAAAARQELGLPPAGPVLALVGRFGPYKGHAVLLEAFAAIHRQHPDALLLFIGAGGSEEEAIKAAVAQHPARERIRLSGYCRDLERWYPAMTLLVSPSTNEGMSNVALEAMACGVPILANTGCGNEAFIENGQNGWITALHSPHEIANRVLELLGAADQLHQAGKKARATVEAEFSLEKMARAYLSLYRQLAG